MKILTLRCNGCGAPLRVAESARFISCSHCEVTLEVMRDGGTIWTEERVEEIASNVADLELDMALMKLDREWEQERESHLVRGQGGPREPKPWRWFGQTILWAAIALFTWNFGFRTAEQGPPRIAALLPGFFALFTVFMGVREHRKKNALEAARRGYENRRRTLLREAKNANAEGAR